MPDVARPDTIARAGLLAFVGLVALEHPLRPGIDPTQRFISEYALGPTQPLAVLAFLAWGTAMAASAVLAWRGGGRVTAAALVVAAVGTVVAASFATVTVGGELPEGAAYTTSGRLHDLGTLGILAGLLVAAVGSTRRWSRPGYRWGVVACAAALVLAPGVLVAAGLDWPGIGQRALVLVGVGWGWLFVRETTRGRRTPARA